MVDFTFVVVILFSSLFPDCDCISDVNDPKIQKIVSLIEEKWESIKSVEARYTVIIENKERNTFYRYNVDYKLSGNNYVLSFIQPAREVVSIDQSPKKHNDNIPQNLWEVLIKKINKGEEKRNQHSLENYDYVMNASYFYKGKFYNRLIFWNNNEERYIIAFPLTYNFLKVGNIQPRLLWGAFKYQYEHRGRESPYNLAEFFKQEGIFCYKEKDDFKILWHEARLFPEEDYKKGIEVWFDKEDKLVKVRDVSYIGRVYSSDIEKIKETAGKDISCDYPEYLLGEIKYSDFHPIWGIPLKMESSTYSLIFPENFDNFQELLEGYKSKKISRPKFLYELISASLGKKVNENIIMEIDKDTFKVNIPINENEFIPPRPNKGYDAILEKNTSNEKLKNWGIGHSHILYIIICIVLIGILFTVYKKIIKSKGLL